MTCKNIMGTFALGLVFKVLISSSSVLALDALKPVRTESPRETMRTFMDAMNTYREGLKDGNAEKLSAIERATRTLNLSDVTPLLRVDLGRKAAIYLKEVIDRVLVVDYQLIPSGSKDRPFSESFWRLKDTEIIIRKVTEGERAGEFLFSGDTVSRAKDFYELVKDYPYQEGSGEGAGFKLSPMERLIPVSLKGDIFSIPYWQVLGIFLAILLGFVCKHLVEIVINIAKKLASNSVSHWDDKMLLAVEGPIGYCVASGFWFLSVYVLRLEGPLLQVLTLLIQFIFSCSVIWIFYRLADVWIEYLALVAKKTDMIIDNQLLPLFSRALRVFVVVFGGLIAVQNLGINVMSVIAGLGLGGLAFALAAKDTAANLFGSIMIIWDRPFRIGDWIVFGEVEGTVEDVGFRSTRVRTFYNSLVTIPNAVVANCNIDNMGKRQWRRVKTVLGITYGTPPEKVEAFIEGIKAVLLANPAVKNDNFQVVFHNYGSSSLDILLYAFLEVPDWSTELRQRQNIFLEIMTLAKSIGVEFAFPTQSLHVESFPDIPSSLGT